MKIIITLISLASLAVVLSSCARGAQPAVEKTVYVGPEMIDCVGVAPQKCLLVKENPQDEYRMFYDTIEGFEFEPGYVYELVVMEGVVENPPADASAIKWTLVEVVSKTPIVSTLEGVLWGMVSYLNAGGDLVDALPGSTVTAEFKVGQVSGNGGCNNYFGSAEITGDQIKIGQLGSTEMYCGEPQGLMEQESGYLAALQKAASYKAGAGWLEVLDAQGATILVYQELQSTSLLGTTWVLQSYNNGKGAVVTILSGTEITALFDESGSLSGSAGCNNYVASYKVDGNKIQIGPAATTRMMCGEPQGVMEQEAQYTAVLAQAHTYEIKLERLTIRGTDGQTLLQYVAGQ